MVLFGVVDGFQAAFGGGAGWVFYRDWRQPEKGETIHNCFIEGSLKWGFSYAELCFRLPFWGVE